MKALQYVAFVYLCIGQMVTGWAFAEYGEIWSLLAVFLFWPFFTGIIAYDNIVGSVG